MSSARGYSFFHTFFFKFAPFGLDFCKVWNVISVLRRQHSNVSTTQALYQLIWVTFSVLRTYKIGVGEKQDKTEVIVFGLPNNFTKALLDWSPLASCSKMSVRDLGFLIDDILEME